jgi:mono/diheme cytochrome c family protein
MKCRYAFAVLTTLILFGVTSALAQNAQGEALFKQHCAMCHGPDGKGNTPIGKMDKIPDLHSQPVQSQTDAQLTQIIENGMGKMPAFKSQLNPQQVKELVTYVRSLHGSGS